jgi:oxygen-independent coproporphyrinogen-3 oxidase
MNEYSLYIHIPFCVSFCDYCDFYSVRLPVDNKTAGRNHPLNLQIPRASEALRMINEYIDTLLAEGERLLQKFGVVRIPSVYIGGGTPSALGAAGIGRLLQGLAALLPQAPAEFTVEANPESADEAFLGACRDGGVNRISLGVQSFCEDSRSLVHRSGDTALIPERLALVSEIFGNNFSADLITALPAQDEAILLGDIEKLLSYHPAHVSLYALTVEEGTPLFEAQSAGAARSVTAPPSIHTGPAPLLPSADEADRLWIAGRDALEQAGYGQYEVSNFALPGKGSAHNIRYWRMENWLGLGASSSGTIFDDDTGTARRFTYPADICPWVKPMGGEAVPIDVEELDSLILMKETFLMGFRCIEGPDPELFKKRFGLTLEAAIPQTLAKWRGRGLLQTDKTALTKEGLLLLDPFLIDAFREAEWREACPDSKSRKMQ